MINKKLLLIKFFRDNRTTLKLSRSDLIEWIEQETNFEIKHTEKYNLLSTIRIFLVIDENSLYSINWKKVKKCLGVSEK